MSTARRASVIWEHRAALVEFNSFSDSGLILSIPNTVLSIGVGRGVGKGRSASTGGIESVVLIKWKQLHCC